MLLGFYIGFGTSVEQYSGFSDAKTFYPTYDFPTTIMTIEAFLVILLAGLSMLLFVVSLVSYRRVGSKRFLLVSLAFLLFFTKALVLIASLLMNRWEEMGMKAEFLVLDVIIVVMFYLSIATK